jgi:transcriptional regulator with XRE-family HTH domain
MLNAPNPERIATVGQRLIFARLAKRHTRRHVQNRTRIPELTLKAYEKGLRGVPLQRLRWLAKLYGVRLAWLTDGEGELPPITPPPRKLTELERIMRCL